MDVPTEKIDWTRSVRIVPSRFPPVGLFDRVADPSELESVYAVEAMTNDRLREEVGDLQLVAPSERIAGPGTTPVMAAFTHPRVSRFGDGTFGMYYCADNPRTAVRETVFHRERFLTEGGFEAMDLEMREYLAPVRAEFCDLRGMGGDLPKVYDPDHYGHSQALGRHLRAAGAWGIVYDSVRDVGGHCIGVFRPRAVGPCTQGRHLIYRWNGARIAHILEVSEVDP